MASLSNAEGVVEVTTVAVGGVSYKIAAGSTEGAVRSARLAPQEISAAVTPTSIEVGVDCGMPDMCGMDPCLCGTPDAFGACACNGTKKISPRVSYASSDSRVVTVEEAFGKVWLVPHGVGTATVTATAKLKHYRTTTVAVPVQVDDLTAADGMLGGALAIALALVVAIAWGVKRFASARARSGHGAGGKGGRNAAACLLALALAGFSAVSLTACSDVSVQAGAASPRLAGESLSATSRASDPEATQAITVNLKSDKKLVATGDADDLASDFAVTLNGRELDRDAVKLAVAVRGRTVSFTFSPAEGAVGGPDSNGKFFAVYQGEFSIASVRDDGMLPHLTDAKSGDTARLEKDVTGTLPSGATIDVVDTEEGSASDNVPASATFRVTSPARARAIMWFSLDGGTTKILKHNHHFAQADASAFASDLAAAISRASEDGAADADGNAYTARAVGDTVTIRAGSAVDGQKIDPVIVEGFGVTGGAYRAEESR